MRKQGTGPCDTLVNIQLFRYFANVSPKNVVLVPPIHSDKWPVRDTRPLNQAQSEHSSSFYRVIETLDLLTILIYIHCISCTVWYVEAHSRPSNNIRPLRFGRNHRIPHRRGHFAACPPYHAPNFWKKLSNAKLCRPLRGLASVWTTRSTMKIFVVLFYRFILYKNLPHSCSISH